MKRSYKKAWIEWTASGMHFPEFFQIRNKGQVLKGHQSFSQFFSIGGCTLKPRNENHDELGLSNVFKCPVRSSHVAHVPDKFSFSFLHAEEELCSFF